MSNTFFIVTILTTFISLCFYKKNFWENRFIVLGINTVALIVTFIILNFVLKSTFHNETRLSSVAPTYFREFYVYDTVANKKNWCISDEKFESLIRRDKDKKKLHTYVVISNYKGEVVFNMFENNCDQSVYSLSKHYIVKGKTDKPYMIDLVITPKSKSSWLAPIGVMPVETKSFIVLPESIYNSLPLAYKSIVPGYYDRNVLNSL